MNHAVSVGKRHSLADLLENPQQLGEGVRPIAIVVEAVACTSFIA